MADTADHHDQTTRLPRHVYRKQLKLKKRRQIRQRPYQTQYTTTDTTTTAAATTESPGTTTSGENDEALYLKQKAQWEAKELEYNLINTARKKVLETEKKARKLAMEKWHASLRKLPIPTPSGYSSQEESSTLNTQKTSTIHKTFVSSGHIVRRRTYRDKFELAKKSG
ncbi:hypothetical protein BCR42DRAFT_406558 [Absidia repens]|uniref:Uncharacterized protein n=1 Tax=Absidia repens TaxID=90262 RepID=A0A1X2IWL4_9FUNG|nr:hypothetical protein BCR42DRAFT_406558 [Absidia repens]